MNRNKLSVDACSADGRSPRRAPPDRGGSTLTFSEQVVLLLLDDREGVFLSVGKRTLELALIGSVLMELAFVHRIDTDLERLTIVDPTPVDNPFLDDVLRRIAGSAETRSTRAWVEALSAEATATIQEQALANLVDQGILKREQRKLLPETVQHLWIFRSPRYFAVDEEAKRAPETRLAGMLFSDEIPDPRDLALFCLIDACGILPGLIEEGDLIPITPRIELLRMMDPIGREIASAIVDIERSKIQSMAHPLA